jgi:hypothetical protein
MDHQLARRVQALENEIAELKEQQRQFLKRITMREQANPGVKKFAKLLTYKQAGDLLGGRSADAVQKMVERKQLRAIHPLGGRRAFIDSRDIEELIERARNWQR